MQFEGVVLSVSKKWVICKMPLNKFRCLTFGYIEKNIFL